MTTEVLQKKTRRYLAGMSAPAETRQIQNWLSCTPGKNNGITAGEKEMIENDIVACVKAYADYTVLSPKNEPWWKKITAFF